MCLGSGPFTRLTAPCDTAVAKFSVEREGAVEPEAVDQLETGTVRDDAVAAARDQVPAGLSGAYGSGSDPQSRHDFGQYQVAQHEPRAGVCRRPGLSSSRCDLLE